MKSFHKITLSLAAMILGFLLAPQTASATSVNCPVEPKTGVPIVSGQVYAGANCTLNTATDLDGFVFNANSGDIYQVLVGDSSGNQNFCLTLYDPNGKTVFFGCSGIGQGGYPYVQADVTIAVTGTYTVDINEEGSGTVNYGLSLERIHPTPPDAQAVMLTQLLSGNISPVADTPAFTFSGVTTGQFQVAASLPNGAAANICETVYSPTGANIASGCTGVGEGGNSFVDLDFTPTAAGTYLVLLSEQTNSATTSYNFEVSCLSGNCGNKIPPCTLKDSLSYSSTSSTLTMNFTVGNTAVDTWNAWLTYQNTLTQLFSASQPITNPPVVIPKTTTLPKSGTVGVLTTITTAKGIICSNYSQVNTGTP